MIPQRPITTLFPYTALFLSFDTYIVSLLKAWFGDAATEENDYGFRSLPKITGNHSHFPTMMRALDGGLRGLVVDWKSTCMNSSHANILFAVFCLKKIK